MGPSDMHSYRRNPDAQLPSRVHGVDYANPGGRVPRPVWEFVFRTLGDYVRHVRKVDGQPDEPNVANQPAEPGQPHRCERHNERNCNCTGGTCADDDGGAGDGSTFEQRRQQYRDRIRTPEPNQYGNFRCPVSGLACDKYVCREWCEGSGITCSETNQHWRTAKATQHYRNLDSETGATR